MTRLVRTALLAFAVWILLSSCQSRSVRHARELIASGAYKEAETYLAGELEARPTDADAFLLLGQMQLLVGKTSDANRSFARGIRLRPSASNEIGRLFLDTARQLFSDFPPGSETNDRIDLCLRGAVGRDPSLAREIVAWVMKEGLSSVEKRDGRNPLPLFRIAAEVSPDGRNAITAEVEAAARAHLSRGSFPPVLALVDVLINLDDDGVGLASELLKDVALTMDTKGMGVDALSTLRKAVKINPALDHDIDVLLLRSKLESSVNVAALQVAESTPALTQTDFSRAATSAASMESIARAIEAYRADYDRVPAASNLVALRSLLTAYPGSEAPSSDAWGTLFLYVTDDALSNYRLICAGSDKTFDPASSRIASLKTPVMAYNPTADIILENGRFVQAIQSRP